MKGISPIGSYDLAPIPSQFRLLSDLFPSPARRYNLHSIDLLPQEESHERLMAQPIKEPCKKQACDIQACLSKNNFLSQRCVRVIESLRNCCEQCEYKSTHCASLSGLLKQIQKK